MHMLRFLLLYYWNLYVCRMLVAIDLSRYLTDVHTIDDLHPLLHLLALANTFRSSRSTPNQAAPVAIASPVSTHMPQILIVAIPRPLNTRSQHIAQSATSPA